MSVQFFFIFIIIGEKTQTLSASTLNGLDHYFLKIEQKYKEFVYIHKILFIQNWIFIFYLYNVFIDDTII